MPLAQGNMLREDSQLRVRQAEASFRDRSGQVFLSGQRVFRAIDAGTATALRELETGGFLRKWIGNGKLVETTWPRAEEIGPDSRALFPEANAFLEHERLSFISFPYEWSCSMVADAALLTLDLQIALT